MNTQKSTFKIEFPGAVFFIVKQLKINQKSIKFIKKEFQNKKLKFTGNKNHQQYNRHHIFLLAPTF